MRIYKSICLILFLLLFPLYRQAIEVKHLGDIPINQKELIIQRVVTFSVTEDEYFLFPDVIQAPLKRIF